MQTHSLTNLDKGSDAKLPAIMVGGPPHSGKSVLLYTLSIRLQRAGVPHYVLRACPDGEGLFSNELEGEIAREFRYKGKFDRHFLKEVIAFLKAPVLPLLVDVGGLPTKEQEAIFAACTHAILLIGGPDEELPANQAKWEGMINDCGLGLIANFRSELLGSSSLLSSSPQLTGTLSGLERGSVINNAVIDALLDRITTLFLPIDTALTERYTEAAREQGRSFINLRSILPQVEARDGYWVPEDLPAFDQVLNGIERPALFGRAPLYVTAMAAATSIDRPLWQFDARHGWLDPVIPNPINSADDGHHLGPWPIRLDRSDTWVAWRFNRSSDIYLDPKDRFPAIFPHLDPGVPLILSGPFPYWLLSGLMRSLCPAVPEIAIHYLPDQAAIVVHSQDRGRLGLRIPFM